jgi:hypothetical protein
MPASRKVAMRVNGVRVMNATLRRGEKALELVIAVPFIGEFVIDESFTVELLELIHPPEIRRNLPNGSWRRVSLRILIALLRSGTVHIGGGELKSIRMTTVFAPL